MNQIKFFKIRKDYITRYYLPAELPDEVNTYAKKNNLEILNFSVYDKVGIYVLFGEEKNKKRKKIM